MTLKEQIAVMQGFADGKKVEFRRNDSFSTSAWTLNNEPVWNWGDYNYRLAPDPLDAIAPGHNPAKLTVRQVGEGFRLWSEDEIGSPSDAKTKYWDGIRWHEVAFQGAATCAEDTYRTRKPPGYFLPKPEPARYTVEEIIQTCIDQDVWAGLSEAFRIAIQDPQHGIAAVVARKATQ